MALRLVLDDHLADVRFIDTIGLVALAGHASAADAAQIGVPRPVGMVLAHPTDAAAGQTFGVHAFDRPIQEDADKPSQSVE